MPPLGLYLFLALTLSSAHAAFFVLFFSLGSPTWWCALPPRSPAAATSGDNQPNSLTATSTGIVVRGGLLRLPSVRHAVRGGGEQRRQRLLAVPAGLYVHDGVVAMESRLRLYVLLPRALASLTPTYVSRCRPVLGYGIIGCRRLRSRSQVACVANCIYLLVSDLLSLSLSLSFSLSLSVLPSELLLSHSGLPSVLVR